MSKASFNRLMRKLRKEAADSATFVIITAMPFILLFTGWAIDFTKNAAVLSEYRAIAQESTQAAIRAQDGSGSLLCGQSLTDENDPHTPDTAHYKVSGQTNIARWISGDWTVVSGKKAGFRADRANAVLLAVQSYVEKTGRNYQSDAGDVYTNVSGGVSSAGHGVHNDSGMTGETESGVAAGNDAKFVDAMRTVAGDKTVQDALDNNDTSTYAAGLDGTNNTDNFAIEVWCSKGVDNDDKTNAGQQGTVGSAQRFNTINLVVHDWSGNFVMGMFDRNWTIQRYNIQARAIASWSKTAVN